MGFDTRQLARARAPADVAALLGLPDGAAVLVRRWETLLGDSVRAIVSSYVPPGLGRIDAVGGLAKCLGQLATCHVRGSCRVLHHLRDRFYVVHVDRFACLYGGHALLMIVGPQPAEASRHVRGLNQFQRAYFSVLAGWHLPGHRAAAARRTLPLIGLGGPPVHAF